MDRTKSRSSRRKAQASPRFKVWIELDGRYAFGHGISRMLEAVEQTGSIKDAAASLGKSYRYVWGRIKEAEEAVGRTLVDTRVGGREPNRSALTDAARRLVVAFNSLRQRTQEAVDREFARRFTDVL